MGRILPKIFLFLFLFHPLCTSHTLPPPQTIQCSSHDPLSASAVDVLDTSTSTDKRGAFSLFNIIRGATAVTHIFSKSPKLSQFDSNGLSGSDVCAPSPAFRDTYVFTKQITGEDSCLHAVGGASQESSRWKLSSWRVMKFYRFVLSTSIDAVYHLVSGPTNVLEKPYVHSTLIDNPTQDVSIQVQTAEVTAALVNPRKDISIQTETPKEIFLEFLQTIPHFRNEIEVFIRQHISIPDDATVKREGNVFTLTLPPSNSLPGGRIQPDASLTPHEFGILNRQRDQENLKYLPGKKIPNPNSPTPLTPKVKHLKYFRSLGPGVTRELTSGAELVSGSKIRMKINENTIEFLEGGPEIKGRGSFVTISAIEFRKIEDSLAIKEQGIIRVYCKKSGWMPLPSDYYFIADLGFLFPKMRAA